MNRHAKLLAYAGIITIYAIAVGITLAIWAGGR